MRIQRKLATKNHSNLFGGHRKCQIGLYVACTSLSIMLCHVCDWIRGRLWWCCSCWRADFDSYGQRSWLVIEGDARFCVAVLREKVSRIKVLATQRNGRARYGISVSDNILAASFREGLNLVILTAL